MGFVMIDDGMFEHPKIDALSDKDLRAHLRAMGWCSRLSTDGHVPAQTLRSLGMTGAQAGRLVEAGVWERNGDGGWLIHDYLEFNPPRDPEERKRWYARRRKRNERDTQRDGGVT